MQHADIVRKMVEDVWNGHNVNAVSQYFNEQIMVHGQHQHVKGLENYKKSIQSILTAFPDLTYVIEDIVSENEKVVVRWVGKGTHQGSFLGNAPTKKQMRYEGINIFQFDGNKINECWVNADLYGLLKQLGVLQAVPA